MPAFIENLNRIAGGWLGLMTAVLWQSTLLVAVVTLVALLLHRASPRVRYWLWQIVAIKLLLMPFWVWAVPLPWFAVPAAPPVAPSPSPMPGEQPVVDLPPLPSTKAPALPIPDTPAPEPPSLFSLVTWPTWLMLAWAGVMIWRIAVIAQQRCGLSRLLRLTAPASEELTARVRELAGRLTLKQSPHVVLIDNPGLLFVCGLWGSKLVLPKSLSASLKREEIDQVILHELAHLRRGDLYWGWTIELARIIYFFHPLVYWVGYCLHLERELACDQVAMTVSGHAAGDYAETLVRVASHAVEPAAGTVSMTSGKEKS